MRFRYSLLEPATNERESLPRAPMFLFNGVNSLETLGLLDTGAMTNILPYELGLKLGGVWDERSAYLRIGGGLYPQPAMSFFTMAKVADLPSVKLAFAWVRNPNIPLIHWTVQLFHKLRRLFLSFAKRI